MRVEEKRILAICLFLSLLLAFGLFSIKGVEVEEEIPPPTSAGPRLLPESEMTAKHFMKVGNLPEFKDEGEIRRWLEMLTKLGKELDGPDVPFGGTLVVGHGVGADGYYWVWFHQDKVTEVNQNVITTIVGEINRVAGEIGFTREVPVKFAQATGLGGYHNRARG